MPTRVRPIPEGYEAPTPYLHVRDAAAAIEYYKKAFGATELMRMPDPSGKVSHAEIRIGGGIVMLSDEFPEMGALSPDTLKGTPVSILMYFEDVDAVAKRAVEAGGRLGRAVEDQFYGDRMGKVEDPFGHVWWIATHKEDVSPEDMERRAAERHSPPQKEEP